MNGDMLRKVRATGIDVDTRRSPETGTQAFSG